MKVTPLAIDGAWLIESPVYPDSRGMFREWFRADELANNGVPNFAVKQAGISAGN